MSVQAEPRPTDTGNEFEIVHIACCRYDDGVLCGWQDDQWEDVDGGINCVVCLDIAESTEVCPIDGRVCEVER